MDRVVLGIVFIGLVSSACLLPEPTLAAGSAAVALAPILNFSAAQTTIATGDGTTLAWSASNASACVASGAWSGSVPTSGTFPVLSLTSTHDYELTCSGPGGSAVQSVTLTAIPNAPTVTLSATPTTLDEAAKLAKLTWSSQNARNCVASGAWSGMKSLSGTQSVSAAAPSATFTLTCTANGYTAVQSAVVSVKSPQPVVALRAAASTIASGSSTTLNWTATNTSTCTASGDWSGSKASSATESTGVLDSSRTYVLTCSGPGGSTSQTTTVSVRHLTPTVSLSVGPSVITAGQAATLNWSASGARSCVASGGWSGPRSSQGHESTGALFGRAVYMLNCIGPGGSASQSAAVTVNANAPTAMLTANPSTIAVNGHSVLSWSATDAEYCTATGGWSGSKPTRGSESIGPLTKSSLYVLMCSGKGGAASQSVTVTTANAAPPTIALSALPSTVASGSEATLHWSAVNAAACTASGGWSGSKPLSGSQVTQALTNLTTYTLTCTGSGGSAKQSQIITVAAKAPSVSFSANPSTIKSGTAATLTWTSQNASACIASGAWSGGKPLSGTATTGTLNSSQTYALTCEGAAEKSTQTTTVSVSEPLPTVTLTASPTTVKKGSAATLNWSAANATACSASGAWSGSKPTHGSQLSGPLSSNSSFALACTGSGGNSSQSVIISVSSAAPTVTLTAAPSTVSSGTAALLTWSADNANSCNANGAWSGSKATSGSQSTGTLKANASFALSCTGPGGSTSQSVTVSVAIPPPTVALTASPATVSAKGSASLSWSTKDANSCAASGGWNGSRSVSGSENSAPLTATTKFTLSCTGPGGTASQSATVTVTSAAPVVSMSATPSSVAKGSAANLTWTSSNTTACVASGGWTGAVATQGSKPTTAINANTTYQLTCTGPGGSASQSATVSVLASTADGTATLSWLAPTSNTNGTPVTALAGYHIFYGTTQGALNQSIQVSANTTMYEITGLTAGTWYFAVAADGLDGTQSSQSAIGSKTIP